MLFTVETVSCLGACGLAPTLTVNDEVLPIMTPEKAVELLIRNINEPELTKQELILPVSLVERGSVRKIKTETT